MSNENKTAVKEFVQRYINSHEPDTFARNENGLMMYQLKHSGINLESFFEDIIEDFISEQNELASLQTQEKDKEIAELKAECDKYEKQMIEDGIKIEQLKGQLWHSTDDFTNMYNKFQSTIESQQKEIEELREGIRILPERFNKWSIENQNAHTNQIGHSKDFNLAHSICLVTVQKESINLLTPTKEERKEVTESCGKCGKECTGRSCHDCQYYW